MCQISLWIKFSKAPLLFTRSFLKILLWVLMELRNMEMRKKVTPSPSIHTWMFYFFIYIQKPPEYGVAALLNCICQFLVKFLDIADRRFGYTFISMLWKYASRVHKRLSIADKSRVKVSNRERMRLEMRLAGVLFRERATRLGSSKEQYQLKIATVVRSYTAVRRL